jgi:hypothetical protein
VLEDRDVEVDQQADPYPHEPKIGNYLGPMHREQLLDGLDFEQQGSLHDDVRAIVATQIQTLVLQLNASLSLMCKPTKRQFVADTALIHRLEQPRAKMPVNLDTRGNHLTRQMIRPLRLCASMLHPSASAR